MHGIDSFARPLAALVLLALLAAVVLAFAAALRDALHDATTLRRHGRAMRALARLTRRCSP